MNWRDKFTNFMYGRYGVDQLSRFMLVVIFILCVLSLFVRGSFMSFLILLLIILTYYRMFSKNIYKRAAENEKYLKFIGKFKRNGNGYNGGYQNNYGNYQNNYGGGYTGSRANTQDRKNYKYFKCPTCSQKIRIPRGYGKIEIRCPKCSTKFIRRS